MNQSRDFTNRCGNCGKELQELDKYCRYCGTKRGDGEFVPGSMCLPMAGLYGPPLVVKHVCEGCGFKWTEHALGCGSHQYCPKCGYKCNME